MYKRNQGYRYRRLEPWQLAALGLDFDQGNQPEPVRVYADHSIMSVDAYFRRQIERDRTDD
jgi:hypothetical protein